MNLIMEFAESEIINKLVVEICLYQWMVQMADDILLLLPKDKINVVNSGFNNNCTLRYITCIRCNNIICII